MKHTVHGARVLVSCEDESDRFLPEGPRIVSIDGRNALVWVNIQTAADATNGAVMYRYWDSNDVHRLSQSGRPGFFLPTDRPGCVVVGREKEIGLLDLRSNLWTPWATIADTNPRTIINDGEIVPGGRAIVFGTKDVRFADPIANLYLFLVEDRSITVLADKQLCSNGKVLTLRDGRLLLYDIDTPKRNVVCYSLDLASRSVSPSSVTLDLSGMEGFPDGMVDAGDGTVIVAFYNGSRGGAGQAVRFDLGSGAVLEEWTTPGSPRVTCPLLCRYDGRVRLVLTTAVEGMPAAQRASSPNAGDLFIGDTDLIELPPFESLRI